MAVAKLPAWSVAVHDTVIVLPGANDAGALLVTMGDGSRLSLTVGAPRGGDTGVEETRVIPGGAVIVGGVASRFIVIDCEFAPPALDAEHVNIVPAVSVLTTLVTHPVD